MTSFYAHDLSFCAEGVFRNLLVSDSQRRQRVYRAYTSHLTEVSIFGTNGADSKQV